MKREVKRKNKLKKTTQALCCKHEKKIWISVIIVKKHKLPKYKRKYILGESKN